MKRGSGILMHISSLPSPYGIGTLGAEARRFADFLEEAGQHYWQVLPISPTSYGDSPYQSFSTYAGNPYFIDLDTLCEDGLIEKSDYEYTGWGEDPCRVDYGALYFNRFNVLFKAADKAAQGDLTDFYAFKGKSPWLEDYSLYMSLKMAHGGAAWTEWPEMYKKRHWDAIEQFRREHASDLMHWQMVQYFFYKQWTAFKEYVNDKGIELIGDCPIYVAMDSVDVWSHPDLFLLDEDCAPKLVSGCPPDYFSPKGQLWGSPIYDYERMEQDGYRWWIDRIDHLCTVFDVLRIDHFRGFEAYYTIPYGSEDAVNGKWLTGPGMKLFSRISPDYQIIAEDLGFVTDGVRKLLEDTGYPGMRVLQFGFDPEAPGVNPYLPHHYVPNCVAYLGTHDNETNKEWADGRSSEELEYICDYLGCESDADLNEVMLRTLEASVADTAVVTMQDLLGLGGEARMNVPSAAEGNWQWRMSADADLSAIAEKLHRLAEIYSRL